MWDKLKQSLLLNFILVGVCVFTAYASYHMLRQAVELSRSIRNDRQKIRELTQKKSELEAYLAERETPEAIEREAKERLNLKLSGEEVVVVIPPKNSTAREQSGIGSRIRKWFNEFLQ